jgi:hypothetical protein
MKWLSYIGTLFFANGSVIMGRREYYLFEILAPHVPKVWIHPWGAHFWDMKTDKVPHMYQLTQ